MFCYVLLEQNFDVKFAYRSIRDRETIQLTGRGIDAVGVVNLDKLMLVLAEAKVSDEGKSPPNVVDNAADSLSKQHKNHIADIEITTKKIWDLGRRSSDQETQELFLKAYLYLDHKRWDKIELLVSCFLVRPKNKYTQKDYGSFRTQPNAYSPANINFWVICIPDTVQAVVTKWHEAIKRIAGTI